MRFVAFLAALIFATPAICALTANTVEISVDITDTNASAARAKAMAQANRQAIVQMATRYANPEGISTLEALNDEQMLNFITSTTVINEKVSTVRYMATLQISVNVPILRQYLEEKSQSNEDFSSTEEINVLHNFSTLSNWLTLEKKLQSLPMVEKLQVVAIGSYRVQFKLIYHGDMTSLIKAISPLGLGIQKEGEFFTISQF